MIKGAGECSVKLVGRARSANKRFPTMRELLIELQTTPNTTLTRGKSLPNTATHGGKPLSNTVIIRGKILPLLLIRLNV